MAHVDCKTSRLLFVKDSTGRYLVDTGSEVSLVPPTPEEQPVLNPHLRLRAANGSEIPVYGYERELSLNLGMGRPYKFKFIPAKVPVAIIGADFLREHGLLPDMRNNRLIDCQTYLSIPGSKTEGDASASITQVKVQGPMRSPKGVPGSEDARCNTSHTDETAVTSGVC